MHLEAPEEGLTRAEVPEYLRQFWGQLHPYVASFVLTTTFWMQHSVMLRYVQRCDRGLAWLNILFLLPLTLLPFLTRVRAMHPGGLLAESWSGLGLVLASLASLAMWLHASRGYRLISPAVKPEVIRSMSQRILTIAALTVGGVLGSLVNTYLGTGIFVCIPLLLMSHKALDQAADGAGTD